MRPQRKEATRKKPVARTATAVALLGSSLAFASVPVGDTDPNTGCRVEAGPDVGSVFGPLRRVHIINTGGHDVRFSYVIGNNQGAQTTACGFLEPGDPAAPTPPYAAFAFNATVRCTTNLALQCSATQPLAHGRQYVVGVGTEPNSDWKSV